MEKSIYQYIWRFSRKQQLVLVLLSALSLPFLYLFYEVPKTIVNEAIQGRNVSFPIDIANKAHLSILGLDIPVLGTIEIPVEQTTYLFLLCGLFLLLVTVNQAFKYVISVYQGLTGERMLRRLRFDLYSHVLRFPLPTFRKMSQGEIIPMITAEVEPLGGFIGDSFTLPAFQGGYLVTILLFLFIQDWRMAAAAVMLYPLQLWIIPRLQKKVNLLGKERVRGVRRLSDRVGETVQGIQEIHAHDTSNFILAHFANQLHFIYRIREQIYIKKFIIKFLNNSIQQLGPFCFYAIGGYFVITGNLEIGTLVAAIAAHKDLAAPWKELLNFYQQQADAEIKYQAVVSQFEPAGLRDNALQLGEPPEVDKLTGEFMVSNLTLLDDQDSPVIDGVSLRLPLDRRTAIVGTSGSGKEELAMLLAHLLDAQKGTITVSGLDVGRMHEGVSGRRMAYVSSSAFVFSGTIADNLFFGLKHRPLKAAEYDEETAGLREVFVKEAARSGNLDFDVAADWIDYSAAGAADAESLRKEALRVLHMVGMDEEIYQFGLRGTVDPSLRPDVAEAILTARKGFRERLSQDPQLVELVESFDLERYNLNATVGENLLFGNPVREDFDVERLAENPYVLEVLDEVDLTGRFLSVGYQAAATMVELFADLPPDHELFQQFSFVSADELPELQALLQRADKNNLAALQGTDRTMLLSLPFKLIPARHRLGLIEDDLQDKILEARKRFSENLPEHLRDAVEFFDLNEYNAAANIQDNILFGKVTYGFAQAAERVGRLMREVVGELGLHETVAEVGLGFDVGIAGSRLSGSQRQKLTIARAVLKRPDVLILSEATAALDSAMQAKIMENLLSEFEGRCLIWSVQRASMADRFDQVLVMRQGKIAEQGAFEELRERDGHIKELLAAE